MGPSLTQPATGPTVPGYQPAEAPGAMAPGAPRFVANVSWPRSGHGLLVRILRATFGPRWGYCEFYGPGRAAGSPCCRAFPCRDPKIHMSKQHDLGLAAELPADAALVVQIRAFAPSAVSRFEYALSRREAADTAAGFRAFAEKLVAGYRAFCAKWIEAPRENRLVLPYEALTGNAVAALLPLLALFGADALAPRLAEVVQGISGVTYTEGTRTVARGLGVRDTRDVAAFRHYDAGFFAELAAKAGPARRID